MLLVMLCLGLATLQDQDVKPTESEVRSAHAMLQGTWQLVSVVDNGDVIGPQLIRRKMAKNGAFRVANRTITHTNPESGESKTIGYMINPAKSPRHIDLITQEERILKGIYKFEGDDLVVCYANRDNRPRPEDFDSPEGSFRILMKLKVGEDATTTATPSDAPAAKPARQPDDSSPDGEAARPAKTRSASLSTQAPAREERRPTESELRRERDLLGGNWRIESIEDDGEKLAGDLIRAKIAEDGVVRIGVRGLSIISPRDEQKHLWAYRIDPTRTPKHIDVTTQFDAILKGIYTFEGDRLVICVAKTEEAPRPVDFDASEGTRRILYRLRMLKDDPPPVKRVSTTAPAPVVPQPPPQPSPEELARRREQQIRDLLVGSWSMTDKKGTFVAVFRPDGSFTSTRTMAKKRLFEDDTITSNGTWTYGHSILSARVTGTTDRNMLGYGFAGRLQSIGDDAMVTSDNTGKLLTLKRVR
ncbi:MAG: TIGR03067 domain-containing protein [Isosphaeraceae bacterium]